MQDVTYAQFETEREGCRIVLEFPGRTLEEAAIHEEVKQILSNLLQEQISQMKGESYHAKRKK